MVCTLLAGVNVVAFAADDNDLIESVKCFYNDAEKGGDGEHLFTKDEGEISWLSSLPTWNNQGEAWKAPVSSSLAIYRCYNPFSGEHHYAAAGEAEWLVSQGWTQEKLAFYSDDNMGVPVYRLWNGLAGVGSHYYTTNEFEKDILVAGGWQFEGVNFYGVKGEEPTTKALSAAQVGSDKIMVSSEDGFTGEESFVVSHGDLVDELADLDYDEELGVYTITLADPIVEAVYTVSCDGYTPATFEGEESEKEMIAVQTGAKEITVTSEVPFEEGVEFEVSHGLIEDTVDWEFDDDMCTATLTLDADIVEATYTVECSDEEYDAAEFVGEKAEVSNILFPSDLLVLTQDQTAGGTVFITVDQWGEPIEDNTRDFKVSSGFVSDGRGNWNDETGMGTLVIAKTPAGIIAEGTKIPVSVVYANSTKVENVVLTASASSIVSNIEVGEIVPLDEDLEDLRVTNERMFANTGSQAKYGLPITATDQYGMPVDFATLNGFKNTNQLFVTPLSGVVTVGDFAKDDETGITYLEVFCADPTKYGLETINFLSRSGFSTTANLMVYPMEVIDAIDVSVDDLQVGKPVPFAFVATDQYGDLVDITKGYTVSLDPGVATGTTIKINRTFGNADATISTTYGSYFTATATGAITLTAGSDAGATGQETLKVQTATNKISLPTVKVNAKATPAYVKGFADDVNTVFSCETATAINVPINTANLDNFVIVDSYGEEMTTQQFNDSHYNFAIEATGTHNYTEITGGAIQLKDGVTAPDNAVTETYKVTITSQDGKYTNTKNVTVTVAGKIKSYVAGFANAQKQLKTDLYVGVDDGDTAYLSLVGLDSKGNMVAVTNSAFSIELFDDEVAGAKLAVNTAGVLTVQSGANIQSGVTSDTACVEVYDKTSGKFLTEADIDCSNIPPMAVAFVGVKGTTPVDLEEGLAAATNAPATLKNGETLGFDSTKKVVTIGDVVIRAFDQYGNVIDIDKATLGGKNLTGAGTVGFEAGSVVTLNIVSGDLTEKVNVLVTQ